MDKPIALALADLHAHEWKEPFEYKGDRLKDSLLPLKIIGEKAKELNIPILFTGDLFHNWKSLSNKLLDYFIYTYQTYVQPTSFFAISGNHDQSEKNTPTNLSPSYIQTFSRVLNGFRCIDCDMSGNNDMVVMGIPYFTHNIGFKDQLKKFINLIKGEERKKILMIHMDLPGATNAFGFEIGESKNLPKNLNKYFKCFDLVLCGHIHKPQKLGKNVYMLGSPYQQNAGDAGVNMGYWEIYKDKKPKFIKMDLPEYKKIIHGEPIPDGKDIYIKLPKPKADTSVILNAGFNNKNSKTQIAKTYLKKKGIKSKSKKKALIDSFND